MKNKFSGERILSDDPRLRRTYYQSVVAYKFASKYTRDKRVLDLACGDGYGSNMLSQNAKSVTGIDYDLQTIQNARVKYKKQKNVKFARVDFVKSFPALGKFDVVVSFQAIEHFKDLNDYLSKIKKLLKKGGVFIVSTPNKDQVSYGFNPYHFYDFDFKILNSWLSRYFSSVNFYGVFGNKNASKAKNKNEKLAKSLMNFLPLGLVNLIPNYLARKIYGVGSSLIKTLTYMLEKEVIDNINEKSFFVSKNDVKKSLDLLAVCKK